ncbi:MAG: hypothetical protein COA97_05080 [Flavobacteriales bacterium]|nr:MAG: hypothetical protein COA97_05080 [Flavobacteriales bacterium]
MSVREDLQKQFRQQQEKFIYYLLALSVTAIGFAIHKTTGLKLQFSQIPVGIAVFSWAISVYCGLMFLKYVIATLFVNEVYFQILEGDHPQFGNHIQKQEIGLNSAKEAMKSNSDKAEKLAKWQGRLFLIGMCSFIVWHVTEMILIQK